MNFMLCSDFNLSFSSSGFSFLSKMSCLASSCLLYKIYLRCALLCDSFSPISLVDSQLMLAFYVFVFLPFISILRVGQNHVFSTFAILLPIKVPYTKKFLGNYSMDECIYESLLFLFFGFFCLSSHIHKSVPTLKYLEGEKNLLFQVVLKVEELWQDKKRFSNLNQVSFFPIISPIIFSSPLGLENDDIYDASMLYYNRYVKVHFLSLF